jgi:hypothetical protein
MTTGVWFIQNQFCSRDLYKETKLYFALLVKQFHYRPWQAPATFTLKEIPLVLISIKGHAVAQLVKALYYKPEGRGFDSQWFHSNFSLT